MSINKRKKFILRQYEVSSRNGYATIDMMDLGGQGSTMIDAFKTKKQAEFTANCLRQAVCQFQMDNGIEDGLPDVSAIKSEAFNEGRIDERKRQETAGYSNFPTFTIALHISQTAKLYNSVKALALRLWECRYNVNDPDEAPAQRCRRVLADDITCRFEADVDRICNSDKSGWIGTLLRHSLDSCNWLEIAWTYIDDNGPTT